MTDFLKKYQFDGLIWLTLIGIYAFSRLVDLAWLVPIFTDEAIYLRWSQVMASDAALRYLPLSDGKPPLFMWLMMVIIKAFPSFDILFAGRLVSVAAGLGSLVGIFFTSYVLFKNKKVSYLASLLYLLSPFALFYDRFALADSLLSMFGIWALGLSILLVRKIRLDLALILGALVGCALLTKTPAIFFLLFLPASLIFFDWKQPKTKINLLKLLALMALVVLISEFIFSLLRLFPLFHMIGLKNSEFIVSPKQFLERPFEIFPSTFATLARWQVEYLTIPVSLLVLLSTIFGLLRRTKATILLSGYYIFVLITMSSFNKVIFPRYLLQLTPLLLMLASAAILDLEALVPKRSKVIALITFLLFLIPAFYVSWTLLTFPKMAPIAGGDRDQYFNAWPAGYGVRQIVYHLEQESKKVPQITVGTEGTFGLMPYALELYQSRYPNAEIKPYWPLHDQIPQEISEASAGHPTYFIMYQRQDVPLGWQNRLREVLRFRQGSGKDHLRLYQVLPE